MKFGDIIEFDWSTKSGTRTSIAIALCRSHDRDLRDDAWVGLVIGGNDTGWHLGDIISFPAHRTSISKVIERGSTLPPTQTRRTPE